MLLNLIEFNALIGPGIYIFWAGDTPLYVGATSCGLNRPLHSQHIARAWLDQVTLFHFESMPDVRTAFDTERELIADLKPKYNGGLREQRRREEDKRRAIRAQTHLDLRFHRNERRVLERYHLREFHREWPKCRIVGCKGFPIVLLEESPDGNVYYSRPLDQFVSSPELCLPDSLRE